VSDIDGIVLDVIAAGIGRELLDDAFVQDPPAAIVRPDRLPGPVFRKINEDETLVQVVHVQVAPVVQPEVRHFTILIGVTMPVLRRALGDALLGPSARAEECEIRTFLGDILPETRDWWEVTLSDDFVAVAQDVAMSWRFHGKPWLDRASDLWEGRPLYFPLVAAAASLVVQDRDAAVAYFNRAIDAADNPNGTDPAEVRERKVRIIRAWGRHAGLEKHAGEPSGA
jgi:hypothetical protein